MPANPQKKKKKKKSSDEQQRPRAAHAPIRPARSARAVTTPTVEPMTDPDPREMVRELRDALGLPDIAIPKPPAQVWAEALETVRARSRLLDQAERMVELLRNYERAYPESVFPTPPEHLRAKDAAAADVMRELALPTMARAADVIERLLKTNAP